MTKSQRPTFKIIRSAKGVGIKMMGIALKKYVEDPLIWPRTVQARQYQKTISEKTIQKNISRAHCIACMHRSPIQPRSAEKRFRKKHARRVKIVE